MRAGGCLSREDDVQLMERVVEGDVRAFEVVYERYHRRAHSVARQVTGQVAGAEEATQDAFLILWRRASDFDADRGSLAAWLLSLVRYRSIDWLRSGKTGALRQDLVERAGETIEAPERTEEQVLTLEDRLQARRLVAELPPDQREVIGLTYLAGWTQTQVAERAGLPLGTVKGRARLGLVKLRQAAVSASASGFLHPR
jgi:RNA polymerase sigma-70 factor (ECF subfamily)